MSPLNTLMEFYRLFAAGDVDGAGAMLDDAVQWNQMEGFPGGARRRGRAAVVEGVFRTLNSDWEGWSAAPGDYIEGDGRVVALGVYRGVHRTTGKSLNAPFAHVYAMRDGVIVQFDQFTDTALFVEAIGGKE